MVKKRGGTKKAAKKNSSSSTSDSPSTNNDTSLLTTGSFCPALNNMDKCHNYSVPCCNALREILAEMIPDAMESIRLPGEEDVDVLRIDKGKRQPTLLSLLVRMHLLEERKKASLVQGNATQSGSGTGGGGKKKRRKKKKKKGTVLEQGASKSSDLTVDTSSSFASASSSAVSPMGGESTSSVSDSKATNSCATKAALPQNLLIENDDTNDSSTSPVLNSQDQLIQQYLDSLHGEQQRGVGDPVLPQDNIKVGESKISSTLDSIEEGISTTKENNPTVKLKDPLTEARQQEAELSKRFENLLDQILASTEDGSVSRHPPPPLPPPNRTLPALLKFINSSYNKASTASNASTTCAIPTLPIQELIGMCERVKCAQCRNACLRFVSTLSQKESSNMEVPWGGRIQLEDQPVMTAKKIILNGASIQLENKRGVVDLNVPVAHAFDNVEQDVQVEDAFDYMALEEGLPCHEEPTFSEMSVPTLVLKDKREDYLELQVVQDKKNKLEFLQLCRNLDGVGIEDGCKSDSAPFTLSNFETLIKGILVPCGLYELGQGTSNQSETCQGDEEATPSLLSHRAFVKHKRNLCRSIITHIDSLRNTFETGQNNLLAAEEEPGAANFSPKIPYLLSTCSQNCDNYVDAAGDLMIMLHYATLGTRTTIHDDQKYVQNLMASLWNSYDEMIKGLYKIGNAFRW